MTDRKKPEKRRTRSKGRSRLKEATVLIPLTYNDGTVIPQATIETLREELFATFAGWTAEGTVQGAYRMESGAKRVESLLKISVVLEDDQVETLEDMVSRWGRELGQEAMLLKIADLVVKFIPPRSAEES
ncbi:hypothetical protein AYO44_04750 [Planctomycetaceae bacterium SCGC AG-212-F19]|nr:hypothetical protein AYO44_04750 [Planctomycetaceae bacterium SCGC AG-212-F19]